MVHEYYPGALMIGKNQLPLMGFQKEQNRVVWASTSNGIWLDA